MAKNYDSLREIIFEVLDSFSVDQDHEDITNAILDAVRYEDRVNALYEEDEDYEG
jgi:hypothetical protein